MEGQIADVRGSSEPSDAQTCRQAQGELRKPSPTAKGARHRESNARLRCWKRGAEERRKRGRVSPFEGKKSEGLSRDNQEEDRGILTRLRREERGSAYEKGKERSKRSFRKFNAAGERQLAAGFMSGCEG